ncbi:MAG: dTDP-4-dehydrorhamnose reductase [Pseudomonadota bacterium]
MMSLSPYRFLYECEYKRVPPRRTAVNPIDNGKRPICWNLAFLDYEHSIILRYVQDEPTKEREERELTGAERRYLVIGAKGMLGTDLLGILHDKRADAAGMDVEEIDIREWASVQGAVKGINPDIVINCAALTNVDWCEANSEEAFAVNASGSANIARVCREIGAYLLHISTDYVFDGMKAAPYLEDDPVRPISVYGRSKSEGEAEVRAILPERHCIARTQWLYGIHGKNFVETILGLAASKDVLRVVDDQRGSPTYAADLAEAILALCNANAVGTFHVTNSGDATWWEFAVAAVNEAGLSHVKVEPITTDQMPRPAPRPKNAVLDGSRFKQVTGLTMRPWRAALSDYIAKRAQRA